MIDVDLVYRLTHQIANDNQITDRFPVSDWNRYARMSIISVLKDLRAIFELNTVNTDNISGLKVKVNLNVVNGKLTKPSDYLYLSAPLTRIWYKDSQGIQRTSKRPVEVITDNELGDRLSSQFNSPTLDYPIITDYGNEFEFYPNDVSQVTLAYIRMPKDPIWAFTVVDGEPVYDPNNSQDFELSADLLPEIVKKICEYMGVSIKRLDLAQYSLTPDGKNN